MALFGGCVNLHDAFDVSREYFFQQETCQNESADYSA